MSKSIYVSTPYDADWVSMCHHYDGWWHPAAKEWEFEILWEDEVRAEVKKHFKSYEYDIREDDSSYQMLEYKSRDRRSRRRYSSSYRSRRRTLQSICNICDVEYGMCMHYEDVDDY